MPNALALLHAPEHLVMGGWPIWYKSAKELRRRLAGCQFLRRSLSLFVFSRHIADTMLVKMMATGYVWQSCKEGFMQGINGLRIGILLLTLGL
ncbi:hypothetical protein, partial [Pseudomonas sp.]|uniref:hypothetical protein n=1 Tax=Pseudomonas sp. TaxID=306 RepID=UPI004053D936